MILSPHLSSGTIRTWENHAFDDVTTIYFQFSSVSLPTHAYNPLDLLGYQKKSNGDRREFVKEIMGEVEKRTIE